MIKCLIVEDDVRAAEIAESLLIQFISNIEIIGKAQDLNKAYTIIETTQPDLIILDINLPDGTAFDLLQKVDLKSSKVIFTTAHSKYAVDAFRFNALDFLLKPYLPEAFKQAIDRFLDTIKGENYHLELETFYHNHKVSTLMDKKIVLRSKDRIDVVFLKDIIRAEADDNYSKFILSDKRVILISKPLKEFDVRLSSVNFLRVHQSHLVNLHHVVAFNKKDMTLSLNLEAIQIPVAQSKKALLLQYFDQL